MFTIPGKSPQQGVGEFQWYKKFIGLVVFIALWLGGPSCSMIKGLKNQTGAIKIGSNKNLIFKCNASRLFERDVYPVLTNKCISCHSGSGQGGFVMSSSDLDNTYAECRKRLSLDKRGPLTQSRILVRPMGATGHTQIIQPESPEHQAFLNWAQVEQSCENQLSKLNNVRVVPETFQLPSGESINLRAVGDYENGEHLITSGIRWTIDEPTLAEVSPEGLFKGISPGTVGISALVGDKQATITAKILPPAIRSFAISPEAATIAVGKTAPFKVVAQWSDQTTRELTSEIHWSVSNPAVAVVATPNGAVKGLVPGSISLDAEFQGKTASASITVIPPPVLISLSLSPAPVSVPVSGVQQLTVRAHYNDDSIENVTSACTFSMASSTIAEVSPEGLVQGLAPGSTNIQVSYSGKTLSEKVSVLTDIPESVEVFPNPFSIKTGVPFRSQLIATFPDGPKRRINESIAWEIGQPSTSAGEINNKGVLVPLKGGNLKIVAGYLGKTAVSNLKVVECPTDKIFEAKVRVPVLKPHCMKCHGTSGGFDSSFSQSLERIEPQSPNESLILQKSSGALNHEGGKILSISSEGYRAIHSWILAEAECANIPKTVLENLRMTPESALVNVNFFTDRFKLKGIYSDNLEKDIEAGMAWSTSNDDMATVDSTGIAFGKNPGTVTLKASLENIETPAVLEVKGVQLRSISIQPTSATLRVNDSLSLSAIATLSDGTTNDVTNQVSWSSANPAVVSVVKGVVKGLKSGEKIKITGSKGIVTASSTITVYVPILQSISITPISSTLRVGDKQPFGLRANFSDKSNSDVTSQAVWSFSSPPPSSVPIPVEWDHSVHGKVTAIQTGTAAIKGLFGGKSAIATVTVTPATLEAISVSPVMAFAKKDMTVGFSATARYSDGSTRDVTTSSTITWSSSNSAVAGVTPQGMASAKTPGVTNVQASFNGKTAKGQFTVAGCVQSDGFSVVYKTKAEPIFQSKCIRCHGEHGVDKKPTQKFLLKDQPTPLSAPNVKLNFLAAKDRIDLSHPNSSKLILRSSGESHAGGIVLPLGSLEYNTLLGWIYEEQACASDSPVSDVNSNLTRISPDVVYLRLRKLLPNEPEPKKPILVESAFNILSALGLDKIIADPLRFSGTATQVALRTKIAPLCKHEANLSDTRTHSIFSTNEILLQGEVLPTDKVQKLAFAAGRNTWLYPYLLTDQPIKELVTVYTKVFQQAQTDGKSEANASREATQSICMSVLMAPPFLLGNPFKDDIVRKISLEVGRQLPLFSDFKNYRAQTTDDGKVSVLREMFRRFRTTPEYIAGVKIWFQNQLGLRPIRMNPPVLHTQTDGFRGASELAGWNFRYNTPPIFTHGDGSREIKMSQAYFPFLRGAHWDSSLCENYSQEFDPNTTKVVWQHFSPVTSQWETLGFWEKQSGIWIARGGSITLQNHTLKTTTLSDIRLALFDHNEFEADKKTIKASFYKYEKGGLLGTPFEIFDSRHRRVIRYGSDGQPQTGFSKVKLWHTGENAYVCNNSAHFLASCQYRPTLTKNRVMSKGQNEWSPLKTVITELVNKIPTEVEYAAPIVELADSILHPEVLANFRCGVPNVPEILKQGSPNYSEDLAYPPGSVGHTGTFASSMNLYVKPGAAGPDGNAPEKLAIDRLFYQMGQEPYELIEHLITQDLDFRELITADYTFVGPELHQFYQTQGYFMPALPPGFSKLPPTSSSVKIMRNSLVNIPLALMRGSFRDPSGKYSYSIPGIMSRFETKGFIPPRQFSGILTQNAFLEPVAPKMRSFSARIFTRLMCGLPNAIQLNDTQISTQLSRMPINELSKRHTTDSQCRSCHQNLDPLGVALSETFSKAAGSPPSEWLGEFMGFRTFFTEYLYGVRNGGGSPSEGAFLGERVTGIEGVANRLSNSREFARCMVLMAFQNIFGRDPGIEDQFFIDLVTNRFQDGYRFNNMVEEIISLDSLRRGN